MKILSVMFIVAICVLIGCGKQMAIKTAPILDDGKVVQDTPKVISISPNPLTNADPIKLFEDRIMVAFSKPISGHLKLLSNEADTGWTSNLSDDTILLTGNAGQELKFETEYTISGLVKDGDGNQTKVGITFVTKALE